MITSNRDTLKHFTNMTGFFVLREDVIMSSTSSHISNTGSPEACVGKCSVPL